MGGSSFHRDDYTARSTFRAAHAIPVFAHDTDIKMGKISAAVHASLSPRSGKLRESRDSVEHPETVPVAIQLDTTGSMGEIPGIIQKNLPKLMGAFLEAKASGKAYLGNGYPAILISAVDDYNAQMDRLGSSEGCLQIGQFESGMEIDEMISNIWLTRNGGGTNHESYQLGVYFMARHTAHDHMDKRGRKGYLFIIGDELSYDRILREEVQNAIGDTLEADLSFDAILDEAKQLYHVFFIVPGGHGSGIHTFWTKKLSQQHVLDLSDPNKICELIVSAVALCEQNVGLADLITDGLVSASDGALVPLSKVAGNSLATVSAGNLPVIAKKPRAKRL